MKRFIVLALLTVCSISSRAQSGKSVVVLKNGTELVGVIKSINPTETLTLVIAGVETKIKMEDVAKVEEYIDSSSSMGKDDNSHNKKEEKIKVTDQEEYLDSFDLKIGDSKMKMILVRGGDIVMGFDGRHSLAMRSEPIHKVKVTSFYMSDTFVTSEIVSQLTKKKKKDDYYKASNWDKANEIVQLMAQNSGLKLRLPTEAEWEYAACSIAQDKIFTLCKDFEFCYDWYDEYEDLENITDPTGPKKGNYHVARAFDRPRGKLDRSDCQFHKTNENFRIVIKAVDVDKTRL